MLCRLENCELRGSWYSGLTLSTEGLLMLCLTKNRLQHTPMPFFFADNGSEDIFLHN